MTTQTNTQSTVRCDCGHESEPKGLFAGYATDRSGKTYCYACAHANELAELKQRGRGVLYLIEADKQWFVTTFTTRITQVAMPRFSWHNICGKNARKDIWFKLPSDPYLWHGYSIGDFTQTVHVRRTKATR